MKKIIFFVLFMGISIIGYSQNIEPFINEAISYLNNTVPNEFRRVNRTLFSNDDGILLFTENNKVVRSSISISFEYTDEAINWLSLFYDYVENNDEWMYVYTTDVGDVYLKNESIIITIGRHMARGDGYIGTAVFFVKID